MTDTRTVSSQSDSSSSPDTDDLHAPLRTAILQFRDECERRFELLLAELQRQEEQQEGRVLDEIRALREQLDAASQERSLANERLARLAADNARLSATLRRNAQQYEERLAGVSSRIRKASLARRSVDTWRRFVSRRRSQPQQDRGSSQQDRGNNEELRSAYNELRAELEQLKLTSRGATTYHSSRLPNTQTINIFPHPQVPVPQGELPQPTHQPHHQYPQPHSQAHLTQPQYQTSYAPQHTHVQQSQEPRATLQQQEVCAAQGLPASHLHPRYTTAPSQATFNPDAAANLGSAFTYGQPVAAGPTDLASEQRFVPHPPPLFYHSQPQSQIVPQQMQSQPRMQTHLLPQQQQSQHMQRAHLPMQPPSQIHHQQQQPLPNLYNQQHQSQPTTQYQPHQPQPALQHQQHQPQSAPQPQQHQPASQHQQHLPQSAPQHQQQEQHQPLSAPQHQQHQPLSAPQHQQQTRPLPHEQHQQHREDRPLTEPQSALDGGRQESSAKNPQQPVNRPANVPQQPVDRPANVPQQPVDRPANVLQQPVDRPANVLNRPLQAPGTRAEENTAEDSVNRSRSSTRGVGSSDGEFGLRLDALRDQSRNNLQQLQMQRNLRLFNELTGESERTNTTRNRNTKDVQLSGANRDPSKERRHPPVNDENDCRGAQHIHVCHCLGPKQPQENRFICPQCDPIQKSNFRHGPVTQIPSRGILRRRNEN
ncbi:chromatin modification-related protein eaf-1 isoform X3 [Hyalella azteca]|uniref:Chromatin modification-related protein eaf-1 isoform X3 n=1 Tax=Hyalella azteca TaxID=294128 RepID=A0A979FTT3_HYAAZ|nr:chromatin modification-related protein eaf-1 isoform X3 [Hyalella azteca]